MKVSMTREEAIEELERLLSHWDELENGKRSFRWYSKTALEVALTALRPISREQVGQVLGGCEWCDEEWGTCNPITNRFTMPPRGGIRFCPMCGKPLTDEAVQMVMERLEELHDTSN